MKYIAPDYYEKFKCIADECKHSCCVGWEIDIDEETVEKYRLVKGDFGERLKNNIGVNDGVAYFKLDCNERCPFLNEKNLCDIILTLGEKSLCQICNDHPRFRNFYSDGTEIGIGLCCEAAAKLILAQTEKVSLKIIGDDGYDDFSDDEKNFLLLRGKLFEILQNRNQTIDERIDEFLKLCNGKNSTMNTEEMADFFLSLERLDVKWTDILTELKKNIINNEPLPCFFDTVAEQLLVYFTYRHLSATLDDGRLSQRASFVVCSYRMIENLCRFHIEKFGNISIEDMAEYARLYSSEIEYSEENIEAILKLFE